MDITKEPALETERRLRAVLRASILTERPGFFGFEEFAGGDFDQRARRDALALVQNGRMWSQLVPLEEGQTVEEPLVVLTFEFSADLPNSGFVGWLANRIKKHTGSGVLVVCGHDRARGGVYDHWGIPAEAADAVRELLATLRAESPRREPWDLEDRWMNAVQTAPEGVIDERTLFHFHQRGSRVWARYQGGEIERGFLCGRVDGTAFHFRYAQLQHDGTVDGGASDCELETLPDGRLQIRERFEWASRDGAGENLIAELP